MEVIWQTYFLVGLLPLSLALLVASFSPSHHLLRRPYLYTWKLYTSPITTTCVCYSIACWTHPATRWGGSLSLSLVHADIYVHAYKYIALSLSLSFLINCPTIDRAIAFSFFEWFKADEQLRTNREQHAFESSPKEKTES